MAFMVLNRDRFQQGVSLASGGEYDRAHAILLECVQDEPGSAEIVEAFLANLTNKFRSAPASDSLAVVRLQAQVKELAAEARWGEVLRAAPQALADNPWHVPTLRAVADACAAEHHFGAELHYLKLALHAAPEDGDVVRRRAEALARAGKQDEALACWRRVEAIDPHDREAARHITRLTVERSRRRHGLAPQADDAAATDAASNQHASEVSLQARAASLKPTSAYLPMPSENAMIRRSPIQELEQAIALRPADPDLYLQLAPLYLEKNREYDAERLLSKAREATDNDPRICTLYEDVAMQRLATSLATATAEAQRSSSPQARATAVRVQRERDRTELMLFAARAKREPEHAETQLQLGLRLKRAGRLSEACRHFELALKDAQLRSRAAFEMGECFQQDQELPQALRSFRMAAESAAPRQIEAKKLSLYQAGSVALRMKLLGAAKRYLQELLALDPAFRDAAELLRQAVNIAKEEAGPGGAIDHLSELTGA